MTSKVFKLEYSLFGDTRVSKIEFVTSGAKPENLQSLL